LLAIKRELELLQAGRSRAKSDTGVAETSQCAAAFCAEVGKYYPIYSADRAEIDAFIQGEAALGLRVRKNINSLTSTQMM
jgi:hypothetical protein